MIIKKIIAKAGIGVLTCCITLAANAQGEKVDTSFHLYLLIGQSNMAGRGKLDGTRNTHPGILMLDSSGNWQPAIDPVHFDKPGITGVGPAIGFAETIQKQRNGGKIGLIPCAWGGSPIKAWAPGATYLKTHHPYDDALKAARIAMRSGVLKGVLWHQGESDNDSAHAAVYLVKLAALIANLRNDLVIPDLPFVAGEIGYFNKQNIINSVIGQLPQRVPHTAVVSAKELTDKGDKVHFDSPSARELGKRYAQAVLLLQSATIPPTVVLCFDDAEISHYTIVAPLLKKYGFGGTFLVAQMSWKSPGDSVYYMTWPQIRELHDMGYEIGNHTGHHKNMTKLTMEQKKAEISSIEEKCKAYGIPRPVSFAYPGNRHDSLSQVVLAQMGYRFARTGGSKLYIAKADPPLAIPSYTMGSTDKLLPRTWNVLKSLQAGQTLVFTIHGVPDILDPGYTTTAEHFEQFLQYMKERQFRVIALRDLDR